MTFPLLIFLSAVLNSGSDADLVRRLQNREARAMAELYDRYGRVVYSVVLRIVRNQGVAEDLVQEAFLRIWNRIHGFDGEKGSLVGWVLAVARNRAVDYCRSLPGRQQERTMELDRMEEPSVFGDLDESLLQNDRVRLLRDAFARLNANQRAVIELAYFEGLTHTEMAERLEEPLGTVKTRVRTALQILRQELAGVAAL